MTQWFSCNKRNHNDDCRVEIIDLNFLNDDEDFNQDDEDYLFIGITVIAMGRCTERDGVMELKNNK